MSDKPLQLLRDGYKHDFASFVFSNERTLDLLAELATEFVSSELSVITDDEDQMELAMMLLECVNIVSE